MIRPLTPDDLPSYVDYETVMSDASGRIDLHHGPFPAGQSVPEDFSERVGDRMATAIGSNDWRRYWGAFDVSTLVGVAHVAGSGLAAESHRCFLGLGVLPSHRRRGLARQLLRAVVVWCRTEPTIEWLDLGVFGQNLGAIELYRTEGFVEIGRTTDRFRVDGTSIDDISMTLAVAR